MSQSTYIVSPGSPITLGSGAPAGSGDKVKADPDNKDDARLIKSGRLVELKTKPKSRAKAQTKES